MLDISNFECFYFFFSSHIRFFFQRQKNVVPDVITFYTRYYGSDCYVLSQMLLFFVSSARKFDSARSVLTRIRRVFRRPRREKLMRTRVAQIRRKTDYLWGALSRLMAHPRKRCFLWRRESITRPLTARSNFTRRNESEKRSLIFIAAIMDFITRFEERKKRSGDKEKREKGRETDRKIDSGRRYILVYRTLH